MALALALAAGAPVGAAASSQKVERLYLDDVRPTLGEKPGVELFLRAETRYGEPVEKLLSTDFTIRDNGRVVDPSGVEISALAETGLGATSVLVINAGRTMKGEPFRSVREAALGYLDRAGSHNRVAVVAFSSEVEVVASFGTSPQQARAALEQLEVNKLSLTALLYDAVYRALTLIRDGKDLPHRSFVIVFSDGKDSGSRRTLEDAIELALGDDDSSRIPVFSVGYDRFGGGSLKSLLKLSRETAAEAFFAQSADLLPSFYEEIWRQILRSYVVRYPGDMDGRHHSVEVAVGDQADTITVVYPEIQKPLWPWLVGLAAAAAVAIAVALMRREPSAGRLVFLAGPRKGESVPLRGKRITLGALPDNDIVVPSPAVSRYHAQIDCRRGWAEIEDVGSRNGTLVNGKPIQSCPLEPGDKLRIGDVDLIYER